MNESVTHFTDHVNFKYSALLLILPFKELFSLHYSTRFSVVSVVYSSQDAQKHVALFQRWHVLRTVSLDRTFTTITQPLNASVILHDVNRSQYRLKSCPPAFRLCPWWQANDSTTNTCSISSYIWHNCTRVWYNHSYITIYWMQIVCSRYF